MRKRVIPVLLLKGRGLYKTKKYSNERYIGDPVNAVKIFNEKEVDEVCILDISAARSGSEPNLSVLKDIASECFMPLTYGGGIRDADIVHEILNIGIEKIALNSAAYTNRSLIPMLSEKYGRSTIVGSIDVKCNWLGKRGVYINGGSEKIPYSPVEWAVELQRLGVGEILLGNIDRDGEMCGYDLDLIREVVSAVTVPVVCVGGASSVDD